MYVSCVTIFVKEEYREEFIKATIENHKNSIKEEGNIRFDFLQSVEDKNRFFLYEAYKTKEAALKHKETEHYKKWKATVDPMMAKPREGIAHLSIMPE